MEACGARREGARGGRRVKAGVWRQACGGRREAAGVWRQACGGV